MNDVVTPLGRPLSDEIRHDLYDRVTGGDQEAVGVAEGGIYVQADQRLHPGGREETLQRSIPHTKADGI